MIFSLTSVQANIISLRYENGSENPSSIYTTELLSVEGKDAYSSIGVNVFNFSGKSNLTLVIMPVFQSGYINGSQIFLTKVEFCEGRAISQLDKKYYLDCDRDKINLKEKLNLIQIPMIDNRTLLNYYYIFDPSELKAHTHYAFLIEYHVKDFVVNKGDSYTLSDIDQSSPSFSRVIYLPEDADLVKIPNDALPFIWTDKSWSVVLYPNDKERYFVTYQIKPFPATLTAWLIGVLMGLIPLIIEHRRYLLNKIVSDKTR